MYDYTHLEALSAVARTGSFDKAAAQLNVTPSAISQRIKTLEDRMGTVLIQRGQPCVPTPTGALLVSHTDKVALLESALREDLLPGKPGQMTTVRVAVNADSLAVWLLPALTGHDGLLFDLVIDDQDHSADWLKRGEVAAAVTGQPGPVQGCDSIPLGALRYVATASPEFVARWMPDAVTAQALRHAPALTFNTKDKLQQQWVRTATGQDIALPTHYIASSHGFIEAALLGLGWGLNPLSLVKHHIAAGRLIPLQDGQTLDTPLFWQISRISAEPLRALTKRLKATARQALIAP